MPQTHQADIPPSLASNDTRASPQNSHHPKPTQPSTLSSKLIPRDYLTTRSTTTSRAGSTTQSTALRPATTQETGHSSLRGAHDASSSEDGIGDSATEATESTFSESASPGKENYPGYHSLNVAKIRSNKPAADGLLNESTVVSSKPTLGSSTRTLHNNMPRTSSIDSAISSVSVSSTQRKDSGDAYDPSPHSIRNLIATAGSAENLIAHLLKEKNHAANQNKQLWKLVEKQRALLLGLNKDLERVTKDRERCRKKLKDLQTHADSPRAATQSPPPELLLRGDAVQSPEVLSSQTIPHHDLEESISTIPPVHDSQPIQNGFEKPDVERPTLQAQTQNLGQPAFSVTEATPLAEKASKGFGAGRKMTPKPLTLLQSNNDVAQQPLINAADRALLSDEDEDDPRGRRKTRADDDREREKSLKKEQEARSKSKKSAVESEGQVAETDPSFAVTLPSSPRPQQTLAPGNAFAAQQSGNVHERLLSLPLRSPGLPSSPRPINNMSVGGLPVSPRAPPPGPLSPRAPKQPIPPPMASPSPFADPATVQRQNAMARQALQSQTSVQSHDRLQVHDPASTSEIPTVYRGLVNPQYPNLLLPPNAIPSIQVQVASSRLRPSRHSMLGLRPQEESTVFSLSVYSRASRNELWRIEKIPASLPQLDQQLRPRCKDLPRVPDRKLFSGHSPVVIDARRQALDAYFEDLLDLEMDETSALLICRFLSTDVLDPTNEPPKHPGVNEESLPQSTNLAGKIVKTGFLTKRGKHFGGWTSRYFVLDCPELRYYETPGGPQIDTIKISQARISTQKSEDSTSVENDQQYRHAFLIEVPKKKDSTSFIRHVLCAESDADRDQWVAALLHYVNSDGAKELDSPAASINAPFTSRPPTASTKDNVQETHSNSPSPTSPNSMTDASIETMSKGSTISGPMNGAPIQNSAAWGNKQMPQSKEKPSKMTNIFHFKKGSQEQLGTHHRPQEATNKPRVLRHNGYVRAVFGLPLADAVEYCSPFNIDVPLPAVVYRSIEYLRFRKASNEEGLFRLSGSNITVKNLKERFNTEGDVDLVDEEDHHDVHAIASLFKTYLRELPSPLLTRDLHIEFLKVLELDSQADKVAAFNTLVHRLPRVNFELLRALSEYLLEVTENAAKNKMSVRNMGIVFSPTVNIPTPVFNLFLSEYESIFGDRFTPATDLAQQASLDVPAGLNPQDIRSPRHQMFSDIPTPAYNQTNFVQNVPESQAKSHQASGSGEFGFIPVHPSYENGQYVSDPQEARFQAYNPPNEHNLPPEGEEQYGSLNRMLVPQGATSDKRRKRESAMLF